ncbi:hypothetical protein CYMTET_52991 [Cymbomonas tetramitiformis]|uniref:Uncharacterized protein n=1 Tax=Cymbomonas tetramitiformis TaxID=36881 RepID=A0AAE0BHX1_9CHLO|nr:hypothetical protein CYMTET_52991 [Cymbomonas tetramitiformis]
MLQLAVLEPNGVIKFPLPTAASVASVMGSLLRSRKYMLASGRRSFTHLWPSTIIYRPKIDDDPVHFVMLIGVVKKNAIGYVEWDSRQCHTGATLDMDPEVQSDEYRLDVDFIPSIDIVHTPW